MLNERVYTGRVKRGGTGKQSGHQFLRTVGAIGGWDSKSIIVNFVGNDGKRVTMSVEYSLRFAGCISTFSFNTTSRRETPRPSATS